MALVTNEWNQVTFHPLTHASWATMPAGGLPEGVLQAAYSATPLLIFCRDATGPIVFTYLNGPEVTVPSATILTDSPKTTLAQLISSTGDTWYNVRGASGASWLWYSDQTGTVSELLISATFGAFVS